MENESVFFLWNYLSFGKLNSRKNNTRLGSRNSRVQISDLLSVRQIEDSMSSFPTFRLNVYKASLLHNFRWWRYFVSHGSDVVFVYDILDSGGVSNVKTNNLFISHLAYLFRYYGTDILVVQNV